MIKISMKKLKTLSGYPENPSQADSALKATRFADV